MAQRCTTLNKFLLIKKKVRPVEHQLAGGQQDGGGGCAGLGVGLGCVGWRARG